jgi:hypothetical protein
MAIILTCETEGCGNANIGIAFEQVGDYCICGVCMNEITNKVETSPEPSE